jgi:hypothetical protein
MDLLRDGIQQLRPVGFQVFIHQLLRPGDILDPGKAVRVAVVADGGAIHLPGQPLAPVHVNVDWEGKPGLQTGTHEAHHGMHPVLIDK